MSISKIFTLIAIVMTVVLSGQVVFAQQQGNSAEASVANRSNYNLESRMKRLTERYALTAEQMPLVKQMLEEEGIKLKAVQAETGQNYLLYQKKSEEMRDATAAKIRLLLTSEQQQKLDLWRKEVKERRARNFAKSAPKMQ